MSFTEQSNLSVSLLIKWGISLLLTLSMFLIPESELITREIKIFLAITIFAIMLVIFDLTDSFVTGIILFMGYSVSGIVDKATVFSAWSNDVAWMIIGALVFAAILENTGIMTRCAYIIIRKTNGSYAKMLWGIYISALVVAFLTSVTGFPLFAPLIYGVCVGMGYKIGSKEANGVVFAAMTGAVAPFAWIYNPINAGVGAAIVNIFDPNLTITWMSYLKIGLPWFFFDLIWMVLITKVFFKSSALVDTAYFENAYLKLGPVTVAQKKAVALTAIVVGYLILSSFLGWTTTYAFSLLPWIAFIPGIDLGSAQAIRKTNFSIVIFTVACLAIGNVGTAVGIGELISQTITPMLMGTSTITYIAGVWLIATLANLLLTPVAVTTALGVPMMQIGTALGIDPLATLFTMMMNTSNVFLPHENSAYLLYFAFGLFTMKDFLKYNSIRMGMHLVWMLAVIVPYWKIIGLL